MERKKLTQLLLSIFIALIFLSSYAAFVNNTNSNQSHTNPHTTITPPQTLYAYGFSNASIIGYNNTMNLLIACKNKANSSFISSQLTQMFSRLEKNNTVSNYYPIQNTILVQAGNTDAHGLYRYIINNVNASVVSCLNFSSTAIVQLPSQLRLSIGKQTYTIYVPQNMSVYQLPVFLSPFVVNQINVKISALVAANGTLYSVNLTKTGA